MSRRKVDTKPLKPGVSVCSTCSLMHEEWKDGKKVMICEFHNTEITDIDDCPIR